MDELGLLVEMIAMHCRGRHHCDAELCAECAQLRDYALARLAHCPHGANKKSCRRCKIHCYSPQRRAQIRAVMRYSGPRMLLRHPILAFRHLFF